MNRYEVQSEVTIFMRRSKCDAFVLVEKGSFFLFSLRA